MVFKMTAQNTRTQQKKRERPSLPESRNICKNVSKAGGLVWLGFFWVVFRSFLGHQATRMFYIYIGCFMFYILTLRGRPFF